jgi:hypothetical protein
VLVRERVLARRIEDDQRAVRDHRSELAMVDAVDVIAAAADADRPEVALRVRLDDAVDVLALFRFRLGPVNLFTHGRSSCSRPEEYNNAALQAPDLHPIAKRLEMWFARHQRSLPWREGYEPYRVWVSEVMLQQTRMEVVLPYFERFLTRFPSVAELAAATDDEVTAAWSGLGYYRRARMLRAAQSR